MSIEGGKLGQSEPQQEPRSEPKQELKKEPQTQEPVQNPLDTEAGKESQMQRKTEAQAQAQEVPKAASKESEKNEAKISPEDYDFLVSKGFDLNNRREVKTNTGIVIEIPRNEEQSAFVKPENFQAWISRLKDEQELAGVKQGLDNAYEGKKIPTDLEKLTHGELESLRDGFDSLAESVNNLYRELFERDRQDLTPLIDSENIDKLKESALNLKSIAESREMEGELLGGAIAKIIDAIEYIGNIQKKRRSVNEDEESLLRVSALLNFAGEECLRVSYKLGGIKKYNAQKIQESVKKLDESAQSKKSYVARKIEAFQYYSS